MYFFRSFESLAEDLTKLLEDNVKVPGAVRNIYSSQGKRVSICFFCILSVVYTTVGKVEPFDFVVGFYC